MRVKLLICSLLGFGLLMLAACAKTEPPKPDAPRSPKVTVANPKIEKVERIITAVGTIDPEDDVQVTTEVAGLVQEVKFEEGQEVRQGEVLVILDPTNFQLNVDNSQALLARARTNRALAEFTYNKQKSLYEKKFVTEQQLQEVINALDRAKAELASAEAAAKIADRALADSVIKSPVEVPETEGADKEKKKKDHVWEVQNKLVSIGEYVNAGKPVAELVNRATLKLRFTVPEQEAQYLAIGKPITFTVPALPKQKFTADIFYIGPAAVESTRSVMVKARFDNSKRLLRPGYSANVLVIITPDKESLTVLRQSLRFDADRTYVFVVRDGILYKKTVTVGIEGENKVEITSGISAEDKVVVRSGSFLDEGTKVEIVEDK